MSLTVGHITYANCVPFFRHLPDTGFGGRIVPGVPSRLNALLASGEVDVSPSSSFEYGRNWRDYLLLPDLSISSCGPVKSVLLFSPRPLQQLGSVDIAVTGESATSVHLLHILLREFYGLSEVCTTVSALPVETANAGRPTLLIGDLALRAALCPPAGVTIYDLGDLWQKHTHLPFVFALWIVRRQATVDKTAAIHALTAQLKASRQRALADLDALAATATEREWLGQAALADYWRAMSYELGAGHLQGLRLFFDLCFRHGFLSDRPEIHFFR